MFKMANAFWRMIRGNAQQQKLVPQASRLYKVAKEAHSKSVAVRHRGKTVSVKARANISAGSLNRPKVTDETKAKMSLAKRPKVTDEIRAKCH